MSRFTQRELENAAQNLGAKVEAALSMAARAVNEGPAVHHALLLHDTITDVAAFHSNLERAEIFDILIEWMQDNVQSLEKKRRDEWRLDFADRLRELAAQIGAPL